MNNLIGFGILYAIHKSMFFYNSNAVFLSYLCCDFIFIIIACQVTSYIYQKRKKHCLILIQKLIVINITCCTIWTDCVIITKSIFSKLDKMKTDLVKSSYQHQLRFHDDQQHTYKNQRCNKRIVVNIISVVFQEYTKSLSKN